MNTTFSRSQFPNGGWQFHQPQTGWSAPTPKSSTFDQTVRLIIEMRRKNPAAVLKHNLSVDPVNVGNELEAFTRRRLGIVMPAPPPPSLLMPGSSGQVVSNTDEIKRLAMGTAIQLAWERSSEGPVEQKIADYRSAICASCPLNSIGKLEEWKKSQFGSAIRSRTPRTANLARKTKEIADLGLCTGTFCPTQQLASIPLNLIVPKVGTTTLAKLNERCWIRV